VKRKRHLKCFNLATDSINSCAKEDKQILRMAKDSSTWRVEPLDVGVDSQMSQAIRSDDYLETVLEKLCHINFVECHCMVNISNSLNRI